MSIRQFDDLAVLPAMTVGEFTPQQNDAAVRAVLRWARRTTGADLPDVATACAALSLDLSGALQRARDVRMSVTNGHDVGGYPT